MLLLILDIVASLSAVPTPSVSIASPDVTYAGSLTPLKLICNVEFDQSLNESVIVSAMWLKGDTLLSNASDRVFISPITATQAGSTHFTSTLTMYQISTADTNTNFTCRARISPTGRGGFNSTTASEYGDETVILVVEGKYEYCDI